MPKKSGKMKSFSFDSETLNQIVFLCDYYKMSQTALIEFLVNIEFKKKKEAQQ